METGKVKKNPIGLPPKKIELNNLTAWWMDVVYILLWSGVIFALVKRSDAEFGTEQILWFSVAGILFTAYLMVLRGENPINVPNIIVMVCYAGAVGYYLTVYRGELGPEYRNAMLVRFGYLGMLLLQVLNMARSRLLIDFKKLNKKYIYVLCAAMVLMCIFDYESALNFLFPVVLLYLTPMDRKTWKKQEFYIACGVYVSFFLTMAVSLLFYRDVYFSDYRYKGVFSFVTNAGFYSAGALMASVVIFLYLRKQVSLKLPVYIGAALMAVFALVMMFVFQDRSSFLGIIVIAYVYLLVRASRKNKLELWYTVVLTVLLFVGAILTFLSLAGKGDFERVEEFISRVKNPSFKSSLQYLYIKITRNMNAKRSSGVFEVGTTLNNLDRFFSARLSVWYLCIKKIRLFGISDLSVTLPNGTFVGHAHNSYLDWILKYGLLGGVAVIAWFNFYLSKIVKKLKNKNYDYIFAFMWICFCLGAFIVERVVWTSFIGGVLLILQYPFLFTGESDSTHGSDSSEELGA